MEQVAHLRDAAADEVERVSLVEDQNRTADAEKQAEAHREKDRAEQAEAEVHHDGAEGTGFVEREVEDEADDSGGDTSATSTPRKMQSSATIPATMLSTNFMKR